MLEAFNPRAVSEEYLAIERFAEEYNRITYLQLDSYTTQKVNLFALPEHERFFAMEFLLDKIIAALPALKRIFSKPITRLKDVDSVLPVEAVRLINDATLRHAAVHTELWEKVEQEGLRPKKLLTLTHEEEYKIYENVAFTRLIDGILSFVRQNLRLLRDIMYSCQPMRFNLLERTNHLMYFLAIGKLHVGYAHAQDSYHYVHQRCMEKLLFIDRTLRAKLKAPVYRICKKDHAKLALKKTNIFRSQKDYRQVYNLLKLLGEKEDILGGHYAEEFPEKGYADFCTLLALFAAGHFNFTFPEKEEFSFRELHTAATFKGWRLQIERRTVGRVEGLRFLVHKERSYAVCLLFYGGEPFEKAEITAFQSKVPSDEYLFAEPSNYENKEGVYLNLFDVDSFRRLQQLFLRGMVYADETREVCPFCGAPLQKTGEDYECALCKTVISEHTCEETDGRYFSTHLKDYKWQYKPSAGKNFFADKERKGGLFYRNITPLSQSGKLCCPRCGKVHK